MFRNFARKFSTKTSQFRFSYSRPRMESPDLMEVVAKKTSSKLPWLLMPFGLSLLVGKSALCDDEKKTLDPNKIKNRVAFCQYAANDPIEDRFTAVQLKQIDGYFVAVFDGHGGSIVSELAHNKLHVFFDKKMKELAQNEMSTDEKVKEAFKFAFDSVVFT